MKESLLVLFILYICSFSAVAQTVSEDALEPEIKIETRSDNTDKSSKELQVSSINPLKKELELFVGIDSDIVSESFTGQELPATYFAEKPLVTKDAKYVEPKAKEEEKTYKYEVNLSVSVDYLTNNYGTWKTASLFALRRSKDGKILWGEYRLSERKNLSDREITGGIYQPLKNRFAVTFEGSYSNTNEFVPKFALRSEVEKVLKGGWVGHIGFRYRHYSPVKASTVYGQVEKYWGSNRIAYTLNVTNLSNAGTAPSNSLSYNRYYGERINTFGFTVSAGKEEEFVGPIVGVTRSNTFSLTGSFKHWINDSFGIVVDATLHKQGDFYYRRGLNLGFRYRF